MNTTVRERPILFSAPMVRALLAGRKTQTRRLCVPAEVLSFVVVCDEPGVWGDEEGEVQFRCPYGVPGDRLWVKETFRIVECGVDFADGGYHGQGVRPVYASDDALGPTLDPHPAARAHWLKRGMRTWPSIFMPRWASRLTLEVEAVRVEELQEITADDIRAEGVIHHEDDDGYLVSSFRGPTSGERFQTPFGLWTAGWDSINGKRAPWASNPWVWVVTFRRIDKSQR